MVLWRIRTTMNVSFRKKLLFSIVGCIFVGFVAFHASTWDSSQSESGIIPSRFLKDEIETLEVEKPGREPESVELKIERAAQEKVFVSQIERPIKEEVAKPVIERSAEEEVAAKSGTRYPNVPFEFWVKSKSQGVPYGMNMNCAQLPAAHEIDFNNVYWQALRSSNGTFFLYSAFYDVRTMAELKPMVRIVGMYDRVAPTLQTFCQVWFDGEMMPLILPVVEYKYAWYRKWGNYEQGILQPYLISCKVPNEYLDKVPVAVSLVEKPCDTTRNLLRIKFDHPKEKKDFCVCVKGLDFVHDDLSVRLVEWLELLAILGADKVYMYLLAAHPNIRKLLRHYQELGYVDVTPITLPGFQSNKPDLRHVYLRNKVVHKRQNELIPYHDCFYRNLYRYRYVILLDTDEVIVPIGKRSWKELIEVVLSKAWVLNNVVRSSLFARNVYFFDDALHSHEWVDDIPRYMHMLQHVYRSKNYTGQLQYVKTFFNTERVLTIHNHFPLACIGGGCSNYGIETSDAHLQHYRRNCTDDLSRFCGQYYNHTTMDTTIWRYKDELVARTKKTLGILNFHPLSTS